MVDIEQIYLSVQKEKHRCRKEKETFSPAHQKILDTLYTLIEDLYFDGKLTLSSEESKSIAEENKKISVESTSRILTQEDSTTKDETIIGNETVKEEVSIPEAKPIIENTSIEEPLPITEEVSEMDEIEEAEETLEKPEEADETTSTENISSDNTKVTDFSRIVNTYDINGSNVKVTVFPLIREKKNDEYIPFIVCYESEEDGLLISLINILLDPESSKTTFINASAGRFGVRTVVENNTLKLSLMSQEEDVVPVLKSSETFACDDTIFHFLKEPLRDKTVYGFKLDENRDLLYVGNEDFQDILLATKDHHPTFSFNENTQNQVKVQLFIDNENGIYELAGDEVTNE